MKDNIEGCEYRIPKNTLIEFLSNYGEIKSDIVETLFDNGIKNQDETVGRNRTGMYIVKIRLTRNIPQLLPKMGKQTKIFYLGMHRLCPDCFGHHPRSACKFKRVL